MKTVTILFLLLLTASAFGELTKEDIRTILKEEVRPIIKEEVTASEKRVKEYIDLKIETVNARIDAVDQKLSARIDALEGSVSRIWLAILALIAAAVALPQLIIVYSDRKREKEIQLLIQQFREKDEPTPPRS
ncbi:hypothetical protein J4G02_12125 [Candidatus Poribacteria bacterium]|nr:hypothetical protein [Candidatus Poribacteria bacterium]